MVRASLQNGSLDYARYLAACGIVWFHAGAPGGAYGHAGLAFFVIGLVVFGTASIHRLPFSAYTRARAHRLLVPWIACSALYGSLKLAEVWLTSATLDTEFSASMILTGPAIHLWFLPFAFVTGLALYPLLRATVALSLTLRFLLLGLFGLLTLLALALQTPLPAPLAQWLYALPALSLGLCLVFSGGHVVRQTMIILIFGLCGFYAGGAGVVQLLLAAGLLVVCLALPLRGTALSALASRASVTIYLLHPAVATMLARTIDFTEHAALLASLTISLTTAVAVSLDMLLHGPKPVFHKAANAS